MQWSRGMFRLWVLFSVLWIIAIAVLNYDRIQHPNISKAAYIFSSDNSNSPQYAEEYSTQYNDALALKSEHKMVQYEMEIEGALRPTTLFFPASTTQDDAVKLFETHFENAVAKQNERILLARQQNLIEALQAGLLPSLVLLLLGFSIRWVLKGFQKTPTWRD